jgi:hypothetical protein
MSSTSSTPAKSAPPNGAGVGAGTPSPNITPMHDPAHQAKVMKQHKPLGMANRECGGAVRVSGLGLGLIRLSWKGGRKT